MGQRLTCNVLALSAFLFFEWAAYASPVNIHIDLQKPTGLAGGQGSGFLHSLTGMEPPDSFVDPLKIKLWRGACLLDDGLYKRLKKSNATIQYVLSDGFQHPTNQGDCQKQEDIDRWPHQFPAIWQKHVEDEAQKIITKGWDVVWEPWNEPDFWKRDKDGKSGDKAFKQYLEAFLVAYKTIRKLDPKARFSGPSLSAYDGFGWDVSRDRIQEFLEFCAKNNLEVADLTWHGFDDKNISEYPQRVREIKKLAATRYPSVNVQRILISEIVSEVFFTSPGDLVATLKYLDDAGVDLTGRACWDGCWWPTLDGSVGKDANGIFHPTPIWWANYWYASLTGKRYSGQSNSPGVTAFAVTNKKSLSILLGFSAAAGPKDAQDVTIYLHNGEFSTTLAGVEQIADLGNTFLSTPPKTRGYEIKKRNKIFEIHLSKVSPRSAYLIRFIERE